MNHTTDRELLELAAKAAGVPGAWNKYLKKFMRTDVGNIRKQSWCPLTDDGDALRLAVKLGMYLNVYATEMHKTFAGAVRAAVDELHGTDPYAATRRAIVRAAAEIGKSHT